MEKKIISIMGVTQGTSSVVVNFSRIEVKVSDLVRFDMPIFRMHVQQVLSAGVPPVELGQ